MNLIEELAAKYGIKIQPYMRLAVLECSCHEDGNDECPCIVKWRMTLQGNIYRETKIQYLDEEKAIVYIFYCYYENDEEGNTIFLDCSEKGK